MPSHVIHPPVDTEFFTPGSQQPRADYILGVSRFIDYKRLDLVIATAEIVGVPAVIAGSGPLEGALRQRALQASVPVTLTIAPTRAQLRELYREAACLVFPPYEDFGIVPIEAQSCGTPVVAWDRGGSRETVSPGYSGVLVPEQTAEQLACGVIRAMEIDRGQAAVWAASFSVDRFKDEIRSWVASAIRPRC